MSVEFDEQPIMTPRPASHVKRAPLFARLVIQTGIVKTEQGAGIVLMILLALLVIGTLFFGQRAGIEPEPPSPEEYLL